MVKNEINIKNIQVYIFGTEEKKKMPLISSKDIQQSKPLIGTVETETVVEKKKELTLAGLFKLPENEGLCLCFEDASGEWIISNHGNTLSRVLKDATLPRIDSYFCVNTNVGEIVYFMTNGHTFVAGYREKGIKVGYNFPGSLYRYKLYEWRKV